MSLTSARPATGSSHLPTTQHGLHGPHSSTTTHFYAASRAAGWVLSLGVLIPVCLTAPPCWPPQSGQERAELVCRPNSRRALPLFTAGLFTSPPQTRPHLSLPEKWARGFEATGLAGLMASGKSYVHFMGVSIVLNLG